MIDSFEISNSNAAYNIALLYEAQGQLDEAIHWAEQAALKDDKYAIDMLKDLKGI